MKKALSLHNILIFMTMALALSCKKNPNLDDGHTQKERAKTSLNNNNILNCITARDTIFKNGDYVKYIPIDARHYGIEIKMGSITDTLDYSFGCNVPSTLIPRVLFQKEYLALSRGAGFHYRSLTLYRPDNQFKKIDAIEFETEKAIGSDFDGFVFIMNHSLCFYDIDKRMVRFKKLSPKFSDLKVDKSRLYEDKTMIIFEKGDSLVYKLKDFR